MQESRFQRARQHGRGLIVGFLLIGAAGCRRPAPVTSAHQEIVLRVGVARFGSSSAIMGLRPLVQNLSVEGLARIGENGRAEPRLAQGWSVAPDGLSMTVRLRPAVKFHDGTDVTPAAVAQILSNSLPQFTGSAFEDVDQIVAGKSEVHLRFKRPSPFWEEMLEISIRKVDGPAAGTGPFLPASPHSLSELRANRDYYLGVPTIDRILLANYPSVRAAWADLLRGKVDMLYEVGVDSLDLMLGSKSVAVSTFTRPYQYVVVLNPNSPQLRSPAVRRALNMAIDRPKLVRDAFDGHADPSSGPVWPHHWSFREKLPPLPFDPKAAASLIAAATKTTSTVVSRGSRLRFTCLVPPDYERVALTIKRDLEAIGVDMELHEASLDEASAALQTHSFDAVLVDIVEGPSFFRTYSVWHSGGFLKGLGTPAMDSVLDQARQAASDDEYRMAITAFQQFALEEPPAIFLAWGERARAVSKRFDVAAEPGRDILTTLRLWRPLADVSAANRN